MPGPSVPVLAPGGPLPPPMMQLPWGQVAAGGQVFLNQHSFEMLQLWYSALQGQGGLIPNLAYPLPASEALSATSPLVNVWDDGGTWKVRPADTTYPIATSREAHGFVRQSYGSGDTAMVTFVGLLEGVGATLTPGLVFLGAAGAPTSTPNTTGGQITQQIGNSVSAHALAFQAQIPEGL